MTAATICGFLWIVFLVVWLVWAVASRKATQFRESVSSRLSYTILTVLAFYLMFAHDVPRDWLRIHLFHATLATQALAVVLTAAGIGFAFWARAYLGRNWSGAVTVKVDHQLIRTGPYRWVRHPIYTGMILAMIGTAIARTEVRGLVAIVLLYAGFKIKSRIEEHTMMNTFGEQYHAYSQSTGAILPKLW